ncbi:BON domain-containing protein [Inquilinus sp. OTU3971]|uniref:BON domain-containing protein n=1 Tax=Inquilinus sp. OTU3971 TaxID=3043855 RepID=UPI00313B1CD7
MKSDSEIRYQVEQALQGDRRFDAGAISVTVQRGVVTLSGSVRGQLERYQAEGVARRIWGVIGLANEIEMRASGEDERSDPEPVPAAEIGCRRR